MMQNLLAFIFFSLVLTSCDSNSKKLSIIEADSINKVVGIRRTDSIRMSDSIQKAFETFRKSDSIQKIINPKSSIPSLEEFEETTNINHALAVGEVNIVYSKTFSPTISFTATNNSDKTIDLFCMSIELLNGDNTIEKTIEKNLKARSKAEIKFSIKQSGQVTKYRVTKIHYSDGSIFTDANSNSSIYSTPITQKYK